MKTNTVNSYEKYYQENDQQVLNSKSNDNNNNNNKNILPNKINISSPVRFFKKKSIYHGVDENKVKINVLGKQGVNIYSKMEKFVKKFNKNIEIIHENTSEKKKNYSLGKKKTFSIENADFSRNSKVLFYSILYHIPKK
jgi:hypothetical protein